MINRREWLGLSLTAGAGLALNPQLLWAARQQLITRAIPSSGGKLPIVGLGSSATFGQVAGNLVQRAGQLFCDWLPVVSSSATRRSVAARRAR